MTYELSGASAASAPLVRSDDDASVLAALKSVDWDFATAKTNSHSHGIHPYPAKFIPQIPNRLISLLSQKGALVWDPFGGSGTTALEALLLKRRAISTDLNPVAEVVGKAKTTTLTTELEEELVALGSELRMIATSKSRVAEALRTIDNNDHLPVIPNHEKWFTESATKELQYIRDRLEVLSSNAKNVALSCFSREVLGASNQDGETRYAAVEKEARPGDVIRSFVRSLFTTVEKLREIAPALQFAGAAFATADAREPIVGQDFTSIVQKGTVDLVVTSPPYPNATDYHLYHRFRIFWLGHDPRVVGNAEIGSHLRHQKQKTGFNFYIEEMTLVLSNVAAALRPNALAAFVVGDAIFNKEVFRTAEALAEVAEKVGLRKVGIIERDLPESKRSFISPARRLKTEQILILRKPEKEVVICLEKPPYKLQNYEKVLRAAEAKALFESVQDDKAPMRVTSSPEGVAKVSRLAFTSEYYVDGVGPFKTWQAQIENGTTESKSRKDPKYVTHGIHPYKGKFYPQLAKALMNVCNKSAAGTVLDPFCGSGTVLLEAVLGGRRAIGLDINPVAVAIANAKVKFLDGDFVFRDHLLATFKKRLAAALQERGQSPRRKFPKDIQDEIESWFPRRVIAKLSYVFDEIDHLPDQYTRELLRVIVSGVVREISQQDPRDLRIRRRAVEIDDAPVFELVIDRTSDVRRKLRHFAAVANCAPTDFGRASAHLLDATDAETFASLSLGPGSVDLVVTSPPYATALPYIDTDRLSLLLCHGMGAGARREAEERLVGTREIRTRQRKIEDEKIEAGDLDHLKSDLAVETVREIYFANRDANVGFRRKNTAAALSIYFAKMAKVVKNLSNIVSAHGSAFIVIGDTRTNAGGQDVAIKSGQVIQEQFRAAGWRTEAVLPITVTRENVVHAKNTITDNEIYWFRRN